MLVAAAFGRTGGRRLVAESSAGAEDVPPGQTGDAVTESDVAAPARAAEVGARASARAPVQRNVTSSTRLAGVGP